MILSFFTCLEKCNEYTSLIFNHGTSPSLTKASRAVFVSLSFIPARIAAR